MNAPLPERLDDAAHAVRVIAIDVDGTLLRADGTIAPADRAAIRQARARGVVVTLATGRLTSSALQVADVLDLESPLVCADGAVLFCPRRREPLDQVTLGVAALSALLDALRAYQLSPFVFTHGAAHGSAAHIDLFPWLSGWTPEVVARQDLDDIVRIPGGIDAVTAIGVGPEATTRAAEASLLGGGLCADDTAVFPIGNTGHWVLRLTPHACTKATGLELLAVRLGVTAQEVAVIGDWYNDIPMMMWAGHSFAMGQAPVDVASRARWRLRATHETGGAVAEVWNHITRSPP